MTKQDILARSLELFMEKGYDGASMSDIAAATGIKKASLYAHYTGKEDIFSAVFSDVLLDYRQAISSLTKKRTDESALTRLERMFRAFLRYCHQNTKVYFWDRYFYFPPEFIREHMEEETRTTQDEFLNAISVAISEGIERGEIRQQPVESASLAYYYAMIGLSMSLKLYSREELERDITLVWGGLEQGLRKDAQEER
jgi:AcrR family transcriptional regulator